MAVKSFITLALGCLLWWLQPMPWWVRRRPRSLSKMSKKFWLPKGKADPCNISLQTQIHWQTHLCSALWWKRRPVSRWWRWSLHCGISRPDTVDRSTAAYPHGLLGWILPILSAERQDGKVYFVRAQCYKTFFFCNVRVFVIILSVSPFQPSLMFGNKDWAFLREAPFRWSTLGEVLGLLASWSLGLLASWPPGLLASWPPGLLASWPPGLLASWPPGLRASWPLGLLTLNGQFHKTFYGIINATISILPWVVTLVCAAGSINCAEKCFMKLATGLLAYPYLQTLG